MVAHVLAYSQSIAANSGLPSSNCDRASSDDKAFRGMLSFGTRLHGISAMLSLAVHRRALAKQRHHSAQGLVPSSMWHESRSNGSCQAPATKLRRRETGKQESPPQRRGPGGGGGGHLNVAVAPQFPGCDAAVWARHNALEVIGTRSFPAAKSRCLPLTTPLLRSTKPK